MRSVADRYAEALADVAMAQGSAEETRRELNDFAALLRGSSELRTVLESPAVSREDKHRAVEALVHRLGAGRILRNFLFVLLDHRRAKLLPEIQQAFENQLDLREGISRAEVRSARELELDEKAQLAAVLERLTGKQVEAQYRLDPDLIGGAVVRIGSTIYDGSVRTQLERLRARLESSS